MILSSIWQSSRQKSCLNDIIAGHMLEAIMDALEIIIKTNPAGFYFQFIDRI